MIKPSIAIIGSVIAVSIGLGSYIYFANERPDPRETVKFMYERWDISKKKFSDLTNEIGFVDDYSVGYDQDRNDSVKIKFGNMLFELNEDDLKDEGLMTMLNRMGLTVKIKKDEEDEDKNIFEVRYNGELVNKWDLKVGK